MSTSIHQEGKRDGERPEREFSKTRILVDYLYSLFPNYEKYKDIPWTRGSDLDEKRPYYENTLRDILTRPESLSSDKKNIIVFRGDREGDGKVFYLHKLIETCYEGIPHFVWENNERIKQDNVSFRFPIIIDKNSLQLALEQNRKITLCELAEFCFTAQLNLIEEKEKAAAKELAEYLTNEGMIALFLRADVSEDPLNLVETRLIPKQQGIKAPPILVLFSDRSFAAEVTEGDGFYCFDIQPLSVPQIMRYIAMEIPDCLELLSRIKWDPNTIEILEKQERLLKQVQIWKKNSANKYTAEISFLDVEKNYIDDLVGENEKLRRKLYFAAECEIQGKIIPEDTIRELAGTDFFEDGHFTYAGCKFFLIAEKIFIDIFSKKRNITPAFLKPALMDIMRQWPAEVQYYLAVFIQQKYKRKKYRKQRFVEYWKVLTEVLELPDIRERCVPAKVLINTMAYANMAEQGFQKYVDWAVADLENDTYDERSLVELSNLMNNESDNVGEQVQEALLTHYQNAGNNNKKEVQRRIVYFYSRAGIIVPPEIVRDLENAKADIHLRYHIVSALIDTLDISGANQMEYYEEGWYSEWISPRMGNDTILQSEFETLYYRKEGKYPNNATLTQRVDELMRLLSGDTSYWMKAHAAGALCRREDLSNGKIRSIITGFASIIEKELEELCKGRERNRLKTVSYIVEALCKFLSKSTGNDQIDLKKLAQKKTALLLSNHIGTILAPETAFEVYDCLNSALLLLVCGLVYIKNPQLPLRKLLGEQFLQESSLENLLNASGVSETDVLLPEEDDSDPVRDLPDQMKEWINRQKPDYLQNLDFIPRVNKNYDISTGKVFVGNQHRGMGFLIRENFDGLTIAYCITCKHLFRSNDSLSDVTIQPIAELDKYPKQYALTLINPKKEETLQEEIKNYEEKKKSDSGFSIEDDISIWRAYGIPRDLYQFLFSSNDFADAHAISQVKEDKEELFSFGFPLRGSLPHDSRKGVTINYHYKQYQGDYCTLEYTDSLAEEGKPLSETTENDIITMHLKGYSGAPIVDKQNHLYAMHTGNNHRKIAAVSSEGIKKRIQSIEKGKE